MYINDFTKKKKKKKNSVRRLCSVEITKILSHTFLQKIRESNGFTKEIAK